MTISPFSQLTDLSSQVALVTGGAMGIGAGICLRLAQAGAKVVIVDINQEVGEKFSEELNAMGLKSCFIKTDVSNEAEVNLAIEGAVKNFGALDILVNNAGIYPSIPVRQMELTDLEKVLAVNLKSVFLFSKAAAEVMIKQGKGGKIINITSIDALHPSAVGLAAYDASKHGVWGFTKNLALELANYKIRVNAIAPGGIGTPGTGMSNSETLSPEMKKIFEQFVSKIPLRRMGEADDIAKVALFLASDMASYMTGSQIVVDGGVLLS